MLIHQLIRLCSCFLDHGICLCAGIRQNRILVADDLLVLLDLIWNTQTQFYQQLLQLFLIYQNLCIG